MYCVICYNFRHTFAPRERVVWLGRHVANQLRSVQLQFSSRAVNEPLYVTSTQLRPVASRLDANPTRPTRRLFFGVKSQWWRNGIGSVGRLQCCQLRGFPAKIGQFETRFVVPLKKTAAVVGVVLIRSLLWAIARFQVCVCVKSGYSGLVFDWAGREFPHRTGNTGRRRAPRCMTSSHRSCDVITRSTVSGWSVKRWPAEAYVFSLVAVADGQQTVVGRWRLERLRSLSIVCSTMHTVQPA